ncbi:MAG: hypothetical protein HFJ51_00445 [Clostridia bacterium]|nr:hypothetical protein [Clostridia bacterium]
MRTQVHFGKPTAQKISEDVEVRNWDPTDPDKKNPWKEYVDREQEPSNSQANTNNTNKADKTNNTTNSKNNTNNNVSKRKQYTE